MRSRYHVPAGADRQRSIRRRTGQDTRGPPREDGRKERSRPTRSRGGFQGMETAAAGTQEPGFRTTREVLGSVRSAMQFLAGVDMTQLPGECIAELLTAMEQVDAGQAAVRGKAVSVLRDQHLYHDYGHRTA